MARAGLVANSVPFGIPAAAHRPGSSVQDCRQVQGPVDQRVPGRRGVGQIDRDLGVLDPPGGAGVLALHTHRVDSLLEVPGLVNHQDGVRVAQVVDDVPAKVVADQVGVPHRRGTAGAATHPVIFAPRCSAMDQQFFRSRSDSNPSINAAACRRGSCRVNRPPIRSRR